MKIDVGTSYLNLLDPVRATTRGRHGDSVSTTDSQALSKTAQANAASSQTVDFTNMTRQELVDWTNAKISNGELTLDNSHTFISMTLKMPVNGNTIIPVEGDTERFDFIRKASDGIAGARQRADDAGARMLEMALSIMQRHQGQTVGIDIQV